MNRFILSGSTASVVERHCPKVLDFREAKAQEDTHIFETGTAAHAVLEAAQRLSVATKQREISLAVLEEMADDVVKKLTTEPGRDRHPLGITRALEGRALALRYLRQNSLDGKACFEPDEIPEQQVTVDGNWRVVAPESVTAAFSGRFDKIHPPHEETMEDGSVVTVVTLLDYKSAWPTDADELKSWQFRQYTCLIAALYPQAVAIKRVVVNLRTGASYDDLLWLDDAGEARLKEWRRGLAQIRAHVSTAPRIASPGGSCLGCPYARVCTDALRTPDETPESIAAQLVAAGEVYDSLMQRLRPMLSEEGQVKIPGGAYGYHTEQEAQPIADAPAEIIGLLTGTSKEAARETHPQAVDFIAAMKPGAANIRNALKRAFPAKGDAQARKDAEARILPKVNVTKFGFFKPTESP